MATKENKAVRWVQKNYFSLFVVLGILIWLLLFNKSNFQH